MSWEREKVKLECSLVLLEVVHVILFIIFGTESLSNLLLEIYVKKLQTSVTSCILIVGRATQSIIEALHLFIRLHKCYGKQVGLHWFSINRHGP